MNIVMVSNTYLPHVGGVANSIAAFTRMYRKFGHRVMIVAPEFDGMPTDEIDTIRVAAKRHIFGSDFSVRLPLPIFVSKKLEEFQPEIVHSHHPFLLGDTAVRLAEFYSLPLIFTHHTLYEEYTHYLPLDSEMLKRFIIELATGYTNLCDRVIAPSTDIHKLLLERGTESPITVIPTGVDITRYESGDGDKIRAAAGIPECAFVIGHTGRLAKEKNLLFLARVTAAFLQLNDQVHFLVAGDGNARIEMEKIMTDMKVQERAHFLGMKTGQELIDIYHAYDVFLFTSKSETQGMVLTEAMAAGTPIVALDANGVRDLVVDEENGRMVKHESVQDMVLALDWVYRLNRSEREVVRAHCRLKADEFSLERTTRQCLELYRQACLDLTTKATPGRLTMPWRLLGDEWQLWHNRLHALTAAIHEDR